MSHSLVSKLNTFTNLKTGFQPQVNVVVHTRKIGILWPIWTKKTHWNLHPTRIVSVATTPTRFFHPGPRSGEQMQLYWFLPGTWCREAEKKFAASLGPEITISTHLCTTRIPNTIFILSLIWSKRYQLGHGIWQDIVVWTNKQWGCKVVWFSKYAYCDFLYPIISCCIVLYCIEYHIF